MTTKISKNTDRLINGLIMKVLISFSIPFMLSTLLQTLYSTVDTIVVGQNLGSTGLSGVTNGSQIMQVIYMFCIGFSSAGQVLIAQNAGAGNKKGLHSLLGTMFYLVAGISILFTIISILTCNGFLYLLNTPEEALSGSRSYVLICSGGLIFTGLYNAFSSVFIGLGDSKSPLYFVLIASIINLILDLVFIIVFRWGVAGAAWATILGQLCSVLFSVWRFKKIRKTNPLLSGIKINQFDRICALSITRIGIPMALESCAIQISFFFVAALMNDYGVSVSAAFGVSSKIRNIPTILTQAIGRGCLTMSGQNLGAGKLDRVKKITQSGILISTVTCVPFIFLFLLAPVPCFRLFTQDVSVLAYASMALLAIAISIPARCVMSPCSSLVQAQGFASFMLIISLVDAFAGRVFLSWLLGSFLGMGVRGLFLGYNFATYLTAIPVFVYFIMGIWKKREQLHSLTN